MRTVVVVIPESRLPGHAHSPLFHIVKECRGIPNPTKREYRLRRIMMIFYLRITAAHAYAIKKFSLREKYRHLCDLSDCLQIRRLGAPVLHPCEYHRACAF